MTEVARRESSLERARALLVRQLVAFVRRVRDQEITDHDRRVADELVALSRSLFPDATS